MLYNISSIQIIIIWTFCRICKKSGNILAALGIPGDPQAKNMDNTNKPAGESKKKMMIILGLVAVVAIIVVAALMSNRGGVQNQGENAGATPVAGEAPADAQPYMPEGATGAEGEEINVPEALKEATITVVGANPISKDGTVVTTEGVAVKNDAVPMSPEAPKQTPPVAVTDLPSSVIKLSVSAAGWSPAEFSVNAGAPVTVAITSDDDFTHVFMFDNPSLAAVAVGVSPRETRAITFNAPSEKGEYTLHCDVPGHSGRGETGKMIVK